MAKFGLLLAVPSLGDWRPKLRVLPSGAKSGCDRIHKTITALTAAHAADAVLTFDATNAFKSHSSAAGFGWCC
jgi:hypothetical protein